MAAPGRRGRRVSTRPRCCRDRLIGASAMQGAGLTARRAYCGIFSVPACEKRTAEGAAGELAADDVGIRRACAVGEGEHPAQRGEGRDADRDDDHRPSEARHAAGVADAGGEVLPLSLRSTATPSKSTLRSLGFCTRSLTAKRNSMPWPCSGSTPTTLTRSVRPRRASRSRRATAATNGPRGSAASQRAAAAQAHAAATGSTSSLLPCIPSAPSGSRAINLVAERGERVACRHAACHRHHRVAAAVGEEDRRCRVTARRSVFGRRRQRQVQSDIPTKSARRSR